MSAILITESYYSIMEDTNKSDGFGPKREAGITYDFERAVALAQGKGVQGTPGDVYLHQKYTASNGDSHERVVRVYGIKWVGAPEGNRYMELDRKTHDSWLKNLAATRRAQELYQPSHFSTPILAVAFQDAFLQGAALATEGTSADVIGEMFNPQTEDSYSALALAFREAARKGHDFAIQ